MSLYRVTLSIGYGGGHEDELDVPDDDLEGMTEEEKDAYLDEMWKEWASGYIDGSITKVGD
jgi:hypothetical protein